MTEKRKTLADIRREIDAEFVPRANETGADDLDEELDEKTLQALRVPRRRSGHRSYSYLKIAVLCVLAVELFVLGYLVGRLYNDRPVGAVSRTLTDDAAAPEPPPASAMASPASPVVTSEAPAPVAAREADPAPDQNDARPGVPTAAPPATVAVVRDSPPPSEPRRATPEANRATADANRVRPEASRVAPPQPNRVTPDARLVTLGLPGPGDWVESQSRLRTALREWLRVSGYAAPSSESDDAEVILNADGQTAKTRVPVRVGNHIIIREQRWTRDARGWTVVEEHQVQSPRPR